MKGIRQHRGGKILVCTNSSEFPLSLHLAGIYRFAGQTGDWFVVPAPRPATPAECKALVRLHAPDGVIHFGQAPAGVFRAFERAKLPSVYLTNRQIDSRQCIVSCDHRTIGRDAARLFYRKGLRRFAYVGTRKGTGETDGPILRLEGFSDEIKRLAGPSATCRTIEINADNPFADINLLKAWLTSMPKPCGALAYCDCFAEPLVQACRDLRIDVPGQVCVLGVDNETARCENAPIRISCIEPDFEGCGHLAAMLLDKFLNGQAPDALCNSYGVLSIVERASTQDFGGLHGRMTSVERLLRTQALTGITVGEIATRLGLSVRTLELSYRKTVGKSVRAALSEIRLKEASRLLRNTQRPLDEIAHLAGFSSPRAFAALFRRHHGLSPRAFRATFKSA